MWNGTIKVIDKKPYFGFKCPSCSSMFNYYMGGETSSSKAMIDFIEKNIKEKAKEGTTIIYSCPKCECDGSIDFGKI